MTRIFRVGPGGGRLVPPDTFRALRAGRVVIYPTDTLYGMGVDPRSVEAIGRLFSLKGRSEGNPVPLLLDDAARAGSFAAEVPAAARRLMERFWPGALTIVLPAAPRLPPALRGPGGTVGLRVPDHPVPRALAASLGGAVTGTSANRSGTPGRWRDPREIAREFGDAVEWILWDGPCRGSGPEGSPGSTVVSLREGRPLLLREGKIPFRNIAECLERG